MLQVWYLVLTGVTDVSLGAIWCVNWCYRCVTLCYLVCYRGLLTTLLLTPYEAREAWAVTVARYCIEHCPVPRY